MNITILDTAIGLIFIILLVSLIASAVREIIEGVVKQRAVDLQRGIREFLHDQGGDDLAREIYTHPLIYGLYAGEYQPPARGPIARVSGWLAEEVEGYERLRTTVSQAIALHLPTLRSLMQRIRNWFAVGGRMPSYIPAPLFARALADLSRNQRVTSESVNHALQVLRRESGDDEAAFQARIEEWYNGSMERVSGWYRRRTQGVLIAIGLLAAMTLNIDALRIGDELYRNTELRNAVVANADAYMGANETLPAADSAKQAYAANMKELQTLAETGLPMGWRNDMQRPWHRASSSNVLAFNALTWAWWFGVVGGKVFLGWLITAFAVSLGAPFWFDLLSKFMTVRSTLKPKQPEPEQTAMPRATVPLAATRHAPSPVRGVPAPAQPAASIEEPADDAQSPALVAAGFQAHQWAASYDGEEGVL